MIQDFLKELMPYDLDPLYDQCQDYSDFLKQ